MADLGTTTAPDDLAAESDDRRVTRRRTLPGGRAVVGALLITVSVVGVFATWLTATAAPTTTWVVVATTIAPGDELVATDLREVAIDLPDAQAGRAFATVEEAVGSVALAPLAEGDLLSRSVVRPPSEVSAAASFTFELPLGRALGGRLEPGDRIDVIATSNGRTGFVATDLEVVRGTIDGGALRLTVAVDEPSTLLALGHAVDEAALQLSKAGDRGPDDRRVVADPFSARTDLGTVDDPAGPADVDPDRSPAPASTSGRSPTPGSPNAPTGNP